MLYVLTLSLVLALGSCAKTIPNLKNRTNTFTNAPDGIDIPDSAVDAIGGGGQSNNVVGGGDSGATPPVTDSSSTTSGEISISTCAQLQAIPANATLTYKLANNIDCSATASWNSGQGFIPIQDFKGKFNGNRKIISNITIKPTATLEGIGIFGTAHVAEIYDVGVYNAVVMGPSRKVGILLGGGSGTKIIRSFTTGQVTNTLGNIDEYWTWSMTGGLVGYLNPSHSPAASPIIMDSYSEATVQGATDYTGGLVGALDAGGSTLIKRSYASGDVSIRESSGRAAALTTYTWDKVEDSFATGTAKGGLCYSIFGSITNTFYSGTTTSCGASQGSVEYFKGDVFNEGKAPFTTWDFETIWVQVEDKHPRLLGFTYPDSPSFIATESNDDVLTIGYIGDGNFGGYWKVAGTCSNENTLIKVTYKTDTGGSGYTYVPCVDGNWVYNEMYGDDIEEVDVNQGSVHAEMNMSSAIAWTGDDIECGGPYSWRHEITTAFGDSECHAVAYCSNGRPYVYADSVSTQCTY